MSFWVCVIPYGQEYHRCRNSRTPRRRTPESLDLWNSSAACGRFISPNRRDCSPLTLLRGHNQPNNSGPGKLAGWEVKSQPASQSHGGSRRAIPHRIKYDHNSSLSWLSDGDSLVSFDSNHSNTFTFQKCSQHKNIGIANPIFITGTLYDNWA